MKGADSLVIDRLSHVTNDAQPYLSQMKKKLQKFSRKGLRTLCMSERFISQSEWEKIEELIIACASEPDPEKALDQVAELIEVNMTLIGCSAVEDRLQDEVPECIRDFIKAEIKVWMLTGDKLETAENIGYSCKLIQENFQKLYIL